MAGGPVGGGGLFGFSVVFGQVVPFEGAGVVFMIRVPWLGWGWGKRLRVGELVERVGAWQRRGWAWTWGG